MKKNLNKEKLLLSRILADLSHVINQRDKRIKNQQLEKKTFEVVEGKLERWVADGKHRLKYESMVKMRACKRPHREVRQCQGHRFVS